jgi:hypothetical protein
MLRVLLLSGLAAVSVSALDVSVGTAVGPRGHAVSLPVTLTGAPTNLSAVAFYLTHPAGWPAPTVSPAPAQSHVQAFVDDFSNGVQRVTAFVLSDPAIQNGTLLSLHYAVPASAGSGTYPAAFSSVPMSAPTGPNPEARALVDNGSIASAGHAGWIRIAGSAPYLASLRRLTDGAFQFQFTNSGGSYVVLATTNVSLPLTQWENLGAPQLVSSNLFQFIDPAATNHPARFYQVQEP